ncbi:MAG: glycosyltransferase family 4 protein [Campylobacterota bacterium]|nr:glycosyltransferase family 4 protein [Campylobacterota bacterium]
MNIWIFNHHALTPDMGGGTRHYDFSKELVKKGHKVTIFASSFHYSRHQELKEYSGEYFLHENTNGIDFIWLKTRPYKDSGIGRVINMLDYMKKVQKVALTCKENPDIIIGSSVHLFAVYAAYKVAKKLRVPFIMEVRDIWPQTLIDMGISKWHPFVLFLGVLEKLLYKKADKIITNLPFAYKHIEKFGVKRENIVWISNGVDLSAFENLTTKKTETFLVTYTGSIAQANVLDSLFEVAKRLKNIDTIKFKLYGDGAYFQKYQKYIQDNKLENIELMGLVSKNDIPQILVNSDVLYLGLKDSPLYRYGISLNKIFDYLASNRPIIFASNARNNPVQDSKSGITIKPENADELEKAIIELYSMREEDRKSRFNNGFEYVKNNFSVQFLTNKLENLINGLQ